MATMIVPVALAPAVTADQVGTTTREATLRTGYWLPRAIPAPPAGLQVGTTLADGGMRLVMFPQPGQSAGAPPPTTGQIWPRA